MPGVEIGVLERVKNFSVGICEGAPSTARVLIIFYERDIMLSLSDNN